MESLRQKHERRMREERDGATKLQLAQIADNRSYVETLQDKKFTKTRYRSGISTNPNVVLPRYKVRILGVHGEDVQPPALPWAYPKFAMSGLRGESQGNPVYPVNTLVDVTQDPKTNNYYIERIHPNTVANLADERNSTENRAASGFGVGADTNLYSVPETGISFGTGSASKLGIAPGFEEYSVSVPSIWDNKQNSPRDDADLYFPTFQGSKDSANSLTGIDKSIENAIKAVEKVRKNLTGKDSFLRNTIDDIEGAQRSVTEIQTAISKASLKISQKMSSIMKKAFKKALNKLNLSTNLTLATATTPSNRHATAGIMDLIIRAIECGFSSLINGLFNLVSKALTSIIDKLVNAPSCLIENFVGQFIGQIVGQLGALINSILGTVSNLLGSAVNFIDTLADFIISLLGFLKCESADDQAKPIITEWNILDGAKPKIVTIDINKVFDEAGNVAKAFEEVTNIPDDISQMRYNFDAESAWDKAFDDCDVGPLRCGVPDVIFWGGSGSGAAGNAVVSAAGDLLGVDVKLPGNYTEAPFITFKDKCGNGNGGNGTVVLGPVGVGTTTFGDGTGIGTTGFLGDPTDPSYDPSRFGTGAGSGIGVTFMVTVKNTATGNKFVIDDRLQRTLTVERGKTYIFNQENPSNGERLGVVLKEAEVLDAQLQETTQVSEAVGGVGEFHPLRFSTTKDGIHNCVTSSTSTSSAPTPWIKPAEFLDPTGWVMSDPQGWSTFLKNYGVYPSTDLDLGIKTGVWKVDVNPGTYTFEMQADNQGTISWDGNLLGSTSDLYGSHNESVYFDVDVTQSGTHTITVTIENVPHQDSNRTNTWETNPAAVGWVLKDSNGKLVRSSLDPFLSTPVTVEEPRDCGVEYIRDVTIDGLPGNIGAYSRIIIGNNTPDTLYYYCENHSKMGGVINIVDPDPESLCGRDATVEIAEVDENGGVVAMKNLYGGCGYQLQTNVITEGGNGEAFTVDILHINPGTIRLLGINNKGRGYQVGDVVTILSRVAFTPVGPGIGVTQVIINDSGYNYLPAPDGSKGGMGRTWAGRCQTVIRRKNLNWDTPYDPGEDIILYPGDCIEPPAQKKVCIDDDFDPSLLPGAEIVGISPVPQDMTNFPLSPDGGDTSTFENIGTLTHIKTIFDLDGGYLIERLDGNDPRFKAGIAQWWFYADGEYLGTFIQDHFSQIPQIYKDNILYRIGDYKRNQLEELPSPQPSWVRAVEGLDPTDWVMSDPQGWSTFLKNYGVYPSNTEILIDKDHVGTWEVPATIDGKYTIEVQADNIASVAWNGVVLGQTQSPNNDHNQSTFFYIDNVAIGTHKIKVGIRNIRHSQGWSDFHRNPAAVAWTVKDPTGNIVATSLDKFAGTLRYDPASSYYSIAMYSISKDEDIDFKWDDGLPWFGYDKDYHNAKILGFSDYDIRNYLEDGEGPKFGPKMKKLLDDPNWGKQAGYYVRYSAPPCPPVPEDEGTYPLIVCLEDIIIENPGFGYDCENDTVCIHPDNGSQAVIEDCDGGILKIRVTRCGFGFTELPEVFINSNTGHNAILKPVMKFHAPEEIDVPWGTNVVQVIDCVGNVGPSPRTRVL